MTKMRRRCGESGNVFFTLFGAASQGIHTCTLETGHRRDTPSICNGLDRRTSRAPPAMAAPLVI